MGLCQCSYSSLTPLGLKSVTDIAQDGVMAERFDTGIFVMGPGKGMALIESLYDVEGVFVNAPGIQMVSSGLQSRLKLKP